MKIATRLVELLAPHCVVVDIAGSLRREHLHIKDIEIVCLPKTRFVKTDLFGGGCWEQIPEFAQIIHHITWAVIKGQPGGRYMQIILKGGGTLDLFMPQRHDYYRQLAIRTGSADYAHFILADAWIKKGWCGTRDGLRRLSECTGSATSSWKCVSPNPTIPPSWTSEQEFFEWLGIQWIKPKLREIKK